MSTLHPTLATLPGLQDSFLGRAKPDYGFLPHYLYFLDNRQRWRNSAQIQSRILKPVLCDHGKAWEEWRQFRSAQAEVTCVYLLENYLGGEVTSLEARRSGYTKFCDICARFCDANDIYMEVKSHSGQQHGNKHPLPKPVLFTPQGEEDLLSWLFECRISSATGEPMVPYCLQASKKGADVLIAMSDIFQWKTHGLRSLGEFLVPDCLYFRDAVFPRRLDKSLEAESQAHESMNAVIIGAGMKTTEKMRGLREVWVFDNSALDKLLVICAAGVTLVLPDGDATPHSTRTRQEAARR